MKPPVVFSLLLALGRLPEPALDFLVRKCIVGLAMSAAAPLRRRMRAYLRRILSHQGRPMDEAALTEIIKATTELNAEMLISLLRYPQWRPQVLDLVELPMLETVERLRSRGRGVILASPHFGNLILGLTALDEADLPVTAVLQNATDLDWMTRKGLRWVDVGGGAAVLLKALAANEAVILFDDLDFFPGGRTADFFGAPVFPPHGPPRLALASGAPILPVYMVRDSARRHRFECDTPILPEGRTQEELEGLLLRSMEKFIGRHPGQWQIFLDVWDLEDHRAQSRRMMRGSLPNPFV